MKASYTLTYDNPLVAGNQSLPVMASSPQEAVIRVLGGCDKIEGNRYWVGKLFGTVDLTNK